VNTMNIFDLQELAATAADAALPSSTVSSGCA
jgi:hypothetical protein